jgi:beta-glucanase (GH16 family)
MDFYFDKVKYFTYPLDKAGTGPDNPFRKPHYLLLNLALGGSWGGAMDDSVLPQKYLIDYVRVYRQRP